MEAERAINGLVRQIVEAVQPLQILLFGSAARGELGESSDIDLLVVMPEGVHRRKTAQKLYRKIRDVGVAFDILVATPADLEKHGENIGLVYRTILQEAKEVYADAAPREEDLLPGGDDPSTAADTEAAGQAG